MAVIKYCANCKEPDVQEGGILCDDCFMEVEARLQRYYETLDDEDFKMPTRHDVEKAIWVIETLLQKTQHASDDAIAILKLSTKILRREWAY